MSGWDEYGSGAGSGPEREPSEDRGRAAWSDGESGAAVPPWASAETQTGGAPPPWAAAANRTGGTLPPPWVPPPPGPVRTGPSTPPYTLPPAPPPARGRAGRLLAVIVLTVVVGAGAGAGTWYLTRDHGTGTHTGTGPATSARAADTVSATPSAPPPDTPPDTASATAPASSPVSPSAGYCRTQDPVGYAIEVPRDWSRRQTQGRLAPVVYYDSPGDGRQLQIFEVTEATPYQSLTLAETDPGYGFARQHGYQVLARDRGDTWAELSYRYDDTDKGPRQVIDHRFRAADGTLYAIRSSGPADLDPGRVRAPLATAVLSFCPAGTECA